MHLLSEVRQGTLRHETDDTLLGSFCGPCEQSRLETERGLHRKKDEGNPFPARHHTRGYGFSAGGNGLAMQNETERHHVLQPIINKIFQKRKRSGGGGIQTSRWFLSIRWSVVR